MKRGFLKSVLIWFSVAFFVMGPLGSALLWEPEEVKAATTYDGKIFGLTDPDPNGDACKNFTVRTYDDHTGEAFNITERTVTFTPNWKALKEGKPLVTTSYESVSKIYTGETVRTVGQLPESYSADVWGTSVVITGELDHIIDKLKSANNKVKSNSALGSEKRDIGVLFGKVDLYIACQYKALSLMKGSISTTDPLDYSAVANVNSDNSNAKDNMRPCYFSADTINKFFQSSEGTIKDATNGKEYSLGHHDICSPTLKQFTEYYLEFKRLVNQAMEQLSGPNPTVLGKAFFDELAAVQGVTAKSVHDTVCDVKLSMRMTEKIRGAICSLVVGIHDTLVDLLGSSLNLMATTSGFGTFMPADANTNDDWFSAGDDSKGIQELSQPIELTLEKARRDTSTSQIGVIMRTGYQRVLQFLDSILILIFFIVAIANILQIEISKYSLKKLAPGFLWGFLAAHFSYYIIQVLLEISGVLTRFILGWGEAKGSASTFQTAFQLADNIAIKTPLEWGQIFKVGFFNLFILFAIIVVLILAFLFLCRMVVFAVAVPLAPLAFFGLFFQPASTAWSKWWKTVSGWIFMPVGVAFFLWLAFMYASAASAVRLGFIGQLLNYIIFAFLLIMAIKVPFSMAGEAKMVMNGWANFGKMLTRPAQQGAKMAGYGILNNRMGYDADGNKIGGAAGTAARMIGAPGRGVAQAIRINKRIKDNSKAAEEEAKDRLFNSSIDAEAQRRRLAANKHLTDLDKAESEYKDSHALNAVKKAADKKVSELDDKIAQMKEAKVSRAAIDIIEKQKAAEKAKSEKAEEDMKKAFLADFKRDHDGRDVEQERARLVANKEAPQSMLESLDQNFYKKDAHRETEKAFREEAKKNTEAMAKEGYYRVDTEARLMRANAERLKDQTGVLEDVTQKLIKTEKGRLQFEDDYLISLRKRQIIEDTEAEKAETKRDVRFYESQAKDAALIDKMVEKEAQVEVRDKAKARVMNSRVSDRVFDLGLHDRIVNAVQLNDKAEAARLANLLRDDKLKSELLGLLPSASSSAEVRDYLEKYGGDAANTKAVNRRLQVKFDKRVGEDLDLYAESNLYKANLFDNNAENLRKVFANEYVDDKGKPLSGEKLGDVGISQTALISNLAQGKMIGDDAQKAYDHVRQIRSDLAAAGDPRSMQQHADLDGLERVFRFNITADNEKIAREGPDVSKFLRSDAARRLGLHRDFIKSADKEFTSRSST